MRLPQVPGHAQVGHINLFILIFLSFFLFLSNKRSLNLFLSHRHNSLSLLLYLSIFVYFFVFFFCVPCGRFFLWLNGPCGSYTGKGLMTGNNSDMLGQAFYLMHILHTVFQVPQRTHVTRKSLLFMVLFLYFCNFFWSLL